MLNEELISVIVPIYNVEKYIKKCVDSIINQEYKNLEIILVDDGSPDKCGKICDEYSKIDSRIKVIHKQNGGLSDARNAGIEYSNGEYIVCVDGDDYIERDMISFLYSNIKKYNADMAVCGYSYDYDGKIKRKKEHSSEKIEVLSTEQAVEKMLDSKSLFGWIAWNKLYRKKIFSNVMYPKGKLYEDMATTYKLVCNSKNIVYSEKSKYNYVIRQGSIIRTYKYEEKELDRIEIAKEMYTFLLNKYSNLKNKLDIFLVSQYVDVVNYIIKANDYDEKVIKETKNIIRKNLKAILNGDIPSVKKVQYLILVCNFKLYRYLYKKMKRTGENYA